jgi:hypothetical protein
MECRDAQFYLRFRRPGSDELGPEVAGDLDRHLAGCEHCAADARTACAFDTAVATAMQDVTVPAGLRNKLIAHIAEKRGGVLRRKAYTYAGTAAVLFLALGLTFGLFGRRPVLLPSDLAANLDQQVQNPNAAIQNWLNDQNITKLPEPFDPALLGPTGYHQIKGQYVPFIEFRERNNGRGSARVYVIRRSGPFDLKDLKDALDSNWQVRVYAEKEGERDVLVVVVHTGWNLEPFLTPKPANQPPT